MKQDQKLPIKTKRQSTPQNGQAVVEYLLLAVVTVGLILGMKSVFKKLNDGANKYMGDYIVCLMEFGELPTLGVAAQDLNKHEGQSACDKKFAAFSFDEGRPAIGGGGTGQTGKTGSTSSNSNNSSNSSSSKNGSDKNSNSKNSKSQANSDGGSASDLAKAGADGSGSGPGSGPKSPYKSGRVQRTGNTYGTLDGSSSGDAGKSRVVGEDGDDDGSGPGGKRNRRQGRRGRNYTTYYGENYRAITGGKAFDALSKQFKKTQARKPTSTIRSIAKEDGRFLLSNRKEITPQERSKPLVQSSDDGKFTFGNILRWLMIAGMVIAIVIFFGGQIMNYSNSGE